MKIPKFELERRIEQAYDLHVLTGLTQEQTALQMQVSRSSVVKYVGIKRSRLSWGNKDREKLAAELRDAVQKRVRAYWATVSERGSSKDRLHALDSLRNEGYQLIRLAEKIGIFPMNSQQAVQITSEGGAQQVNVLSIDIVEVAKIVKAQEQKIIEAGKAILRTEESDA